MTWKARMGASGWAILMGVIAAALLLAALVAGFVTAREGYVEGAKVLGALGSFIFSGFLAVLYWQQKEILYADQEPHVEVEDYGAEGDTQIVYLSNMGKGLAKDLELVTVTVFPDSAPLGPGLEVKPLRRRPEDTSSHRRGQSLMPGETVVPFESDPPFPLRLPSNREDSAPDVITYPDQRTTRNGFEYGISILEEQDVSVGRVHFFVRYQEPLGRWRVKYVCGFEFPGDTGEMALEELYESGGPMFFGEPEVLDPDLSFDLSVAENGNDRTIV